MIDSRVFAGGGALQRAKAGKSFRAQAGLEYLVTYGWAILAIVIIAGILWYFGVFNPAKYVEERQCGGGVRFQCLDYRVNASGTLVIVLGNKAGSTLSGVNITSGAGPWSCAPVTVPASAVPAYANVTCVAANFLPASTRGVSFDQTEVIVTFTDARTGVSHTDTLFVKGKYE